MNDIIFTPVKFDIPVPVSLYFISLRWDELGFFIYFGDVDGSRTDILELRFSGRIFAQQIADESAFIGMVYSNTGAHSNIVTVKNSDFTQLFHKETSGVYDDSNTITVAIFTFTHGFEFITNVLPTAAWIDGS